MKTILVVSGLGYISYALGLLDVMFAYGVNRSFICKAALNRKSING